MIVCHCQGVNDHKVRRVVDTGAHTVDEIARACGAGARCGGCWPLLMDILEAQSHGRELATTTQG